MKKILRNLLLLFALFFVFSLSVSANNTVNIYYFWGDGCPHCNIQKPTLEALEQNNNKIKVHYYETWYDRSNSELFNKVARSHGTSVTGVPATFIGSRYWVGYNETIREQIEEYVYQCLENGCNDKAYYTIFGEEPPIFLDGEDKRVEYINIFGSQVEVSDMPLIFSTFLIAFIDGFNPCSLWVLSFLLGIVVLTKNRKKILLIGLTYLIVASLAYGAFIIGMINVSAYTRYLDSIRIFVAVLAIGFAAINIKDFFFYKKGISLTISDKHKPKLYQKVRNIMKPENNTRNLIIGSAALALGITLVELPCTAGFPMIWSRIITENQVDNAFFIFLFIIYLLTYFLIELALFLTAVFTLKVSKFDETHGRLLKLIGGMIMLSLGAVLLIDHTILNDIGTTVIVFGIAIILSIIIAKLHKKYKKEEQSELSK